SALRRDATRARPFEARAPDADAVANRLPSPEHVIESTLRRADHYRAGWMASRVADHLTRNCARLRTAFADARGRQVEQEGEGIVVLDRRRRRRSTRAPCEGVA